MSDEVRMTLRLPKALAFFLDQKAKEAFTSRNAQVVRSIREWMQQETGAVSANSSPVSASNNAALAGGAFITQQKGLAK